MNTEHNKDMDSLKRSKAKVKLKMKNLGIKQPHQQIK